jgi:hypothetical protein
MQQQDETLEEIQKGARNLGQMATVIGDTLEEQNRWVILDLAWVTL